MDRGVEGEKQRANNKNARYGAHLGRVGGGLKPHTMSDPPDRPTDTAAA